MHYLQNIILTRGTNSFAIIRAPITMSIYRFSLLTMMVNDQHFSLFRIDFGSAKYRNQHDLGSKNGCFCCWEWSYECCPSQQSKYYLIGLLWDSMIVLGNPATSDVAINIAAPECAHHWARWAHCSTHPEPHPSAFLVDDIHVCI